MTKKESFLLRTNYLIKQEQYELRALARAVLDLTDSKSWREKEGRSINELGDFLNHLDEQDRFTWNKIVEWAEEKC